MNLPFEEENYKPLLPYIKWQPFSVPKLKVGQ